MNKKDKSIILLSGGLDSAVNLYIAKQQTTILMALTFNYGQKSALKEINSAKKICQQTNVPHKIINLEWFKDFTQTSLINENLKIPSGKDILIDNFFVSQTTAQQVWVPNRNGIFLNIAAGYAEGSGANLVIAGFNKEEAKTFPDNSQEFIEKINQSLYYSTATNIQIRSYTVHLVKSQIIQKANELNICLEDLWPCYLAQENWCKECESCQRFLRALNSNIQKNNFQKINNIPSPI